MTHPSTSGVIDQLGLIDRMGKAVNQVESGTHEPDPMLGR